MVTGKVLSECQLPSILIRILIPIPARGYIKQKSQPLKPVENEITRQHSRIHYLNFQYIWSVLNDAIHIGPYTSG